MNELFSFKYLSCTRILEVFDCIMMSIQDRRIAFLKDIYK